MPRPRCCAQLGAPERVVRVDVDDPASLAAALAGTETVLNATYMRQVVAVTDAAIAAGVHLVDLGAYYPETREQLDAARRRRGRRLPDRPRLRRGARPDQHPRPARRRPARPRRRDPDVLVHHPPDVDLAGHRGDALRCEHGHVARPRGRRARRARLVQRRESGSPFRSRMASRRSTSSRTPSRSPCRARSTWRTSCSRSATRPTRRAGSRVLLELGFDRETPFEVDGVPISPRRFAAAYIGSRGIGPDERSANVKHVRVEGVLRRTADDADLRLRRRARSAGRRRRRSPARSRRSPPTWSPAAGRPASTRPRPRSTRGRSSPRWPNAGLTIEAGEIAG